MMMSFRALIFILLVFAGAFAQARPKRFQQLAPGVFRSAAASTAEDYEDWRAQGIDTIVDLRHGHDAEEEHAKAEKLGFRYVNIPLGVDSTFEDYLKAERAFFKVISKQKGGVVFHCLHGKDRTGLMAALYRVRVQRWKPARAVEEWRNLGGMGDDWGTTIQDYFASRVRLPALSCSGLFTAP